MNEALSTSVDRFDRFDLMPWFGGYASHQVKFMKSVPGTALVEMGDEYAVDRAITHLNSIKVFTKRLNVWWVEPCNFTSSPHASIHTHANVHTRKTYTQIRTLLPTQRGTFEARNTDETTITQNPTGLPRLGFSKARRVRRPLEIESSIHQNKSLVSAAHLVESGYIPN